MSAQLRRLKDRAIASVARRPQYAGRFDGDDYKVRRVAVADRHGFLEVGDLVLARPAEDPGYSLAWSWKGLDVEVPNSSLRAPGAAVAKTGPRRLPTLAECIATGTHMLKCTADGFCKSCFDRSETDLDQLLLVEPFAAATPSRTAPVRTRYKAARRRR